MKLPNLALPSSRKPQSYALQTVISSKGQVVLPTWLRQRDRIATGHWLLKRLPMPDNEGRVDCSLACREKDWVQPVAFESTEAL